MTRRAKITSSVISYLSGISVANGYLTNIGGFVSHWDTQIKPHADTYDINVKDILNEHALGHVETLSLQIHVSYNGANPYTVLNSIILDIHKCLHTNQQALGTAVSENGLRILASTETIDLTREKDKEKGFALIEVNIQHRFTERWTPDLTNYS
jgi:hypothetical protein